MGQQPPSAQSVSRAGRLTVAGGEHPRLEASILGQEHSSSHFAFLSPVGQGFLYILDFALKTPHKTMTCSADFFFFRLILGKPT